MRSGTERTPANYRSAGAEADAAPDSGAFRALWDPYSGGPPRRPGPVGGPALPRPRGNRWRRRVGRAGGAAVRAVIGCAPGCRRDMIHCEGSDTERRHLCPIRSIRRSWHIPCARWPTPR
ncbi:hypothetical protein GCM10027168_64400 [Streptomyces capparidis]